MIYTDIHRQNFEKYVAFSASAKSNNELKPSRELLESFQQELPDIVGEHRGSAEGIVNLITNPEQLTDGLVNFLAELGEVSFAPEDTIDTDNVWKSYCKASLSEQGAAICMMLRITPEQLHELL